MSFKKLQEAFQNHVVRESCWNIPTPIRMSIVGRFNELAQEDKSDSEKLTAAYNTIQQQLATQPSSELETRQILSLRQFVDEHPLIDKKAKLSILDDLSALVLAETVAA